MEAITPIEGMSFGCDPELFIVDSKGNPVSPEEFLPGTKTEPYKVNKGAIQVDGMAAEFNIDPANTFEDFNGNINAVMESLRDMVPSKYSFAIQPSIHFSKEVFDNASAGAKELGCTPDFNAWRGEVNSPPDPSNDPYMRCAGGHVHIGWTNDESVSNIQHVMNCSDLVKQLDWYVGLWSLTKDKDTLRRNLYGKAGACRIKPYGVEYRTLSNFWLKDEETRLELWNRMNTAINRMKDVFMPDWSKKKVNYNFTHRVIHSIDSGVIDKNIAHFFTSFPISQVSIVKIDNTK